MKRFLLSCAVMAMLSACATTSDPDGTGSFSVGTRVLAEYQESGIWWAGTVSAVEGGFYVVAFDDETTDTVAADEIETLAWRYGSPITCSGVQGVIAAYAAGPRTVTVQEPGGTKFETMTATCSEDRNSG